MKGLTKDYFDKLLLDPGYKKGVEEFQSWLLNYECDIEWHLKFEGFSTLPYEMKQGVLLKFISDSEIELHVLLPGTPEEFDRYLKQCFEILTNRILKKAKEEAANEVS